MRDRADNCVIVCSIENLDPMGVHTGDSITVAPAQTLSDVEYQIMRDAAFACIRRVGVETGGSNVQFAVNPVDGHMVVIEMNPRVSRSSALASKATGFPIAKIAARLAVGYTLDEIDNDITKKTPASFEPSIDYVVTKIPRWAFEKFPGTSDVLGTQMQSVGEVMAIGRTFPESLQKGLRSLEQGRLGLNADPAETQYDRYATDELLARAAIGTPERIFQLEACLRRGLTVDEVHEATKVDPWFLDQMLAITEERAHLEGLGVEAMTRAQWRRTKRLGFSDAQLAHLWSRPEAEIRAARIAAGVVPTYKTVDTCAAEFEASTPYHYSTYEDTDEVAPSDRRKVVILGSGPNRIGQGIEFDYCCVHASFALRDAGFETIMVNCNPETVSTDYDTSDRLYFEPLTHEDVMNVIEAERPVGVIVSLGGQTPLKLADSLPPELVVGTSPASIDAAEDRERWNALCARLEIPQPAGGTAATIEAARAITERIGWPALVRPSYVLGGRAMVIVYDDDGLTDAMAEMAAFGSLGKEGGLSAERPGARRPLPRGRHRGRRRRHPRRRRRLHDRRHHGARRGGRRALGRLGVRAAPAHALGRGHRRAHRLHPPHRRRPRRGGAHQRAVRGEERPGLRDRGQPASQPHRALRRQGHRGAAGQDRLDGSCSAPRWPSCAPRAWPAPRSAAITTR